MNVFNLKECMQIIYLAHTKHSSLIFYLGHPSHDQSGREFYLLLPPSLWHSQLLAWTLHRPFYMIDVLAFAIF